MDDLFRLFEKIRESRRIVFFGGAGVSTESGIPDFRSVDGLYHSQYDDPPETILSHSYFLRSTQKFFDFYRQKMIYLDAKPNAAHKTLASLESKGKLSCVITQNIDGLHQAAGSKHVLELHGSIHRNRCMYCNASFDLQTVLQSKGVPHCSCGGIIKPEVVLYGEPLSQEVTENALEEISSADMLIIGGTSLSVYPAAGMIRAFSGKTLALINQTPTPMDSKADMIFRLPIGKVFEKDDA